MSAKFMMLYKIRNVNAKISVIQSDTNTKDDNNELVFNLICKDIICKKAI